MPDVPWGHGIEEIAARLMGKSGKVRENGEHYALETAQSAAAAAHERNRQRSRA